MVYSWGFHAAGGLEAVCKYLDCESLGCFLAERVLQRNGDWEGPCDSWGSRQHSAACQHQPSGQGSGFAPCKRCISPGVCEGKAIWKVNRARWKRRSGSDYRWRRRIDDNWVISRNFRGG